MEMYRDILSPLKNLRGLARLFTHLSDPSACSKKRLRPLDLKKLERGIERCGMGEDYDSVRAGKDALKQSRWEEADEIYGLYGAATAWSKDVNAVRAIRQ
jgi:hypothetical protein